MKADTASLIEVHTVLLDHFGDPHWWPGETPFEVCVGAILTQNTAWSNVERAIKNLKERSLLSPDAIAGSMEGALLEEIKPAGYFNQKGGYLRSFCGHLMSVYGGSMDKMDERSTPELRRELLSLKGIGQETADSMLCYAFQRPVLVIDAYTFRSMGRLFGAGSGLHGTREAGGYEAIQGVLMGLLRGDAAFYNRFHALIVLLCKDHCRREPDCGHCPLSGICEHGIFQVKSLHDKTTYNRKVL